MKFIVCVLLSFIAGIGPAFAQSATNTSGLEGKVTDESGGVLPGVTVTISSPALQAPQVEAVTDENGRFRFTALPRGMYTVTFVLSGFQKLTPPDVSLDAGFIASLDMRMAVGQIEESVTVTGASPVIDVRTTTVTSSIKKDVLETLPTSRSYEDMGKLAPGIRVSGVPDVGGNHTGSGRGSRINYGSSNGGSTLMLDGINTDGTAGYYDMGAVDEMIVNPSGNDPEIPTPGMAFQVIIKSGGNTFHGDGLYAFQTRRLQGNNIDDRLRGLGVPSGNPMDRYYDANGSIGGRIVRDRVWFFTSTRRKEYRQELIGFAGGAGADGRYFTGDEEQGLTTDRESNLTGKVQVRPTAAQAASYMRHYNYKKQDNRSGNAFIPHESAGDYELPNTVHVGEYTNTVSDRSFLRLVSRHEKERLDQRHRVHAQRSVLSSQSDVGDDVPRVGELPRALGRHGLVGVRVPERRATGANRAVPHRPAPVEHADAPDGTARQRAAPRRQAAEPARQQAVHGARHASLV